MLRGIVSASFLPRGSSRVQSRFWLRICDSHQRTLLLKGNACPISTVAASPLPRFNFTPNLSSPFKWRGVVTKHECLLSKVNLRRRSMCSAASNHGSKEPLSEHRGWFGRVGNQLKGGYERLKQRKTELVLLYGSTFIVVHELLGISSYLITYTMLSTGFVDVEKLVNLLGWTEDDLRSKGFSVHDKIVTFAMTVALVKGMDVLGLVPLRWALCILITPRVARYIGPHADKLIAGARKLFKRKPTS